MEYKNGVPFFDPKCGGCVTGDYVNPDCEACQASQDPELVKKALGK